MQVEFNQQETRSPAVGYEQSLITTAAHAAIYDESPVISLDWIATVSSNLIRFGHDDDISTEMTNHLLEQMTYITHSVKPDRSTVYSNVSFDSSGMARFTPATQNLKGDVCSATSANLLTGWQISNTVIDKNASTFFPFSLSTYVHFKHIPSVFFIMTDGKSGELLAHSPQGKSLPAIDMLDFYTVVFSRPQAS